MKTITTLLMTLLLIATTATAQDVYVAGHEFQGTEAVVTLWENGTAQTITDGTRMAIATSVYVTDGDVYIAGYESNSVNYVAVLWKNGVPHI